MQDIVRTIGTSDEFFQKNLANTSDIIVVLYQKLLARNPDPGMRVKQDNNTRLSTFKQVTCWPLITLKLNG